MKRNFLIPASPYLFLTAFVLLATWKLSVAERTIARGDLLLYFYPLREYASLAIREGRLPLWNPYTFMGAPFLANSQVGFFYPFNFLMAWLPVEKQVGINIVLHLWVATLGMFVLAQRGLGLGMFASVAAALTFGMGGYLGAQVEHLNQLQVLAWLPLQIYCVLRIVSVQHARHKFSLWLALIVALQVFAGHTQSLYICLVTLGIVFGWAHLHTTPQTFSGILTRLITSSPYLLLAILLAVLICAAQLLPTLELSRLSYRAGGLSFGEAAAFSWRPWVVARAVLPTFGDPLFAEYVCYFGVAGLALAVLGALPQQRNQSPIPSLKFTQRLACVLALAGFVLALGVVTPVFNVLFKVLPGFSFFRAQARWLVLFALGISMLVGLGTQALLGGLSIRQKQHWLLAWLSVGAVLLIGLWLGIRLSPEAEYKTLPAPRVLLGWAAAAVMVTTLMVAYYLLGANAQDNKQREEKFAHAVLPVLLVIELFAAAQFQPYARASDNQALTALRPATAHLLAEQTAGNSGRVLALSGLFFDPGDLPEQTQIFGNQLSKDELYDRVIASKHKEILSPNLSLYYRIPSVDGYDGGLLPTKNFVQFASQFTPTPKTGALDGRLREFLHSVPNNVWLEKMGVRYLIADKTADIFIDGVYYDTLFRQDISGTYTVALAPYTATALGLVFSGTQANVGDVLAHATLTFTDATTRTFVITATNQTTQTFWGARLAWLGTNTPTRLTLTSAQNTSALTLRAITNIDATDQSFFSQMVRGEHDMKLVHSGDVKIYENVKPAPRISFWHNGTADSTMPFTLTENLPERVTIQIANVQSPNTTLVLRDACYPGWVAQVDGVATPIECADILFRNIALPASAKEIVFTYRPQSVRIGMVLSKAGILLWLVLAWFVLRNKASKQVATTA